MNHNTKFDRNTKIVIVVFALLACLAIGSGIAIANFSHKQEIKITNQQKSEDKYSKRIVNSLKLASNKDAVTNIVKSYNLKNKGDYLINTYLSNSDIVSELKLDDISMYGNQGFGVNNTELVIYQIPNKKTLFFVYYDGNDNLIGAYRTEYKVFKDNKTLYETSDKLIPLLRSADAGNTSNNNEIKQLSKKFIKLYKNRSIQVSSTD